MQNTTINIGGQIAFWQLSNKTNLKALTASLTDLGFKDCLPEPRTTFAALRDALIALYSGPEMLVRPLDGRAGCTVVREEKGETENTYTKEVSITLHDIENFPTAVNPELVALYNKNLQLLHSNSLTTVLVKIVTNLHGTCLRPSGGVYWISKRHADTWAAVAKAVEAAGDGNQVFTLKVQDDEGMIKAVIAGLTAEMDGVTTDVEAKVASGELGERGLLSQSKRAEAAAAKLAEYEAALGVGLESIKARLEAAQTSAFKASLAASAAGEVEATQ
jgi:hypothetical protein